MLADPEHLKKVAEIARSVGIHHVEVGTERPDRDVIIGDPPAGAITYRRHGSPALRCESLLSASDVEAALHELAHVVNGYDGDENEERCYQTAAIWALRFPPAVSARVNEMAREAFL